MLLGSEVLEVAIGLALFFLLLAILVSTINELIARLLQLRHQTLKSGIGMLLADPEVTAIGKELYRHPLIKALEKKGRPSYIHGRTFAAALLDTIAEGATDVAVIRKAVDESPLVDADLKRQLDVLINDAGGDYAALREGVQRWYDDSMERVSGWYKRKTQVVTFAVASVLTLGLNADALALANSMLQNPAAREAFIAQASTAAPPDAAQGVPRTDIASFKAALGPLGFDLGWEKVDPQDPVGWYATPVNWLGRVPGWLVTVLAVLMGAPFWFDAVGRLTNLRSAGMPPTSRPVGET